MSELWTSNAFLVTLAVGLVVGATYLRHMWLALQRAVRTREDADASADQYRHSLIGALLAVVGSAAAISVYGAGPMFLYLGPALALSSAVAVSYCLRTEYRDD